LLLGKKIKHIYINSHPRSGSTFLQNVLNSFYGFSDNKIDIIKYNVVKEHFAPTLLCRIPNTLQVTIFRDPIDCMSSSIMKDIGDFISVPKYNSENFYSYISTKIDIYNEYLKNALECKDELIIFSFNQVIHKTENVVNKIDKLFDFDNIRDVESSVRNASVGLKQSSYYTPFHNNYPIKKGKKYDEYKEHLHSIKNLFDESYILYNHLKSLEDDFLK